MHYGMFEGYTEDPMIFAQGLANNVPEQLVRILQVGDCFIYHA
jgi:hypothetical protein